MAESSAYLNNSKWSNPISKEQWLRRRRRAKRSYSTFKVRRGGSEEIPLVQGKEQWLRFAGAAVKRYLMPPCLRPGVAAGRRNPCPRPGAVARKTNPTSKEPWLHGRRRARGATPRSRSGGAAVRRYPLSKVRSSSCTLLEQP